MLPLIKFYQRSNWAKKQNLINILLLSFLFFIIYAPLHELSHFIAAKLTGVEIINFQFFNKYGVEDFQNAYIETGERSIFQDFVILIAPYVKDIIFAFVSFLILRTKHIRLSFFVGMIFSIGLLYSIFDIVDNFFAYLIQDFGDWNRLSRIIGDFWTSVIGVGMFSITLYLTYLIFSIYKGFPQVNHRN